MTAREGMQRRSRRRVRGAGQRSTLFGWGGGCEGKVLGGREIPDKMPRMSESAPYPIFVHLDGRPVVVVGGGGVALRKVVGLVAAGAAVTVVAPEVSAELAAVPGVICRRERYWAGVLAAGGRPVLVFAATDDAGVNEQVSRDAAALGVLCCRCDMPEAGDFSGGAMWSEGGVMLAVSTGRASPVLAARARDQAAAAIDPLLVRFAALLSGWRPVVLGALGEQESRTVLLRRLAGAEMEGILRTQGPEAAEAAFAAWLAEARKESHAS